MRFSLLVATIVLTGTAMLSADDLPGSTTNPQAVEQVKSGKLTTANAAWWGFDEDDSTDFLQAAILSGAKKVIIPNVGQEWIVRPIKLAGDQELVLEKGVVITAKRGEYRGGGDSVFTAQDVDNLTIKGLGATIRMQKEDYVVGLVLKDLGWNRWYGQYAKAEWRMCLAFRGCNNVTVEGLSLCDSGGDGIYVDGGSRQRYSKNIRLKNVTCDNNYRQGISVISVEGLTILDSQFNNTWGTPPSSGIDIEPDSPDHHLKDILVKNCVFNDNYGDGIEVFLGHLTKESEDISIRFEDCKISSRRGPGMRVNRLHDNGPKGSITFENCVVDDTEGYGIKVSDKSADTAQISFINCKLKRTAKNKAYADAWAPISFRIVDPERTTSFGGVSFKDCFVEDHRDRSPVFFTEVKKVTGVTGNVSVKNKHTSWQTNRTEPEGFELKLQPVVQ